MNSEQTNIQLDLSEAEVHIWNIIPKSGTDPTLLNQMYNYLDPSEQHKCNRFRFVYHKHQYIISHAMTRIILSLYARELSPADWCFCTNKYGKPEIQNRLFHNIRFNLSHTDGLICLSITQEFNIGIDVEPITYHRDINKIARRYFSHNEHLQIINLPANRQAKHFTKLWTLKEAYIKACGKGLAIPLNQFYFDLSCTNNIEFNTLPGLRDNPKQWLFWQYEHTTGHISSVALKTDPAGILYRPVIRQIRPTLNPVPENQSY